MSEEKKQDKKEKKTEMTAQESKAYRMSLNVTKKVKLEDHEKRELFRIFWAENKYQYGRAKDLEVIIWEHLKASNLSDPENFEAGLKHFGLKKIK